MAGVFEVTGAVAMKYAEGLTKRLSIVITVVGYHAGAVFLALAPKKLPLGTVLPGQ